jgi:anaphase-promoting complex subunit 13
MDGVYVRDSFEIDVIDREWVLEKIPFADVNVPLDELPDTELNEINGHTSQTAKEYEMKWNENGLQQTWVIINS